MDGDHLHIEADRAIDQKGLGRGTGRHGQKEAEEKAAAEKAEKEKNAEKKKTLFPNIFEDLNMLSSVEEKEEKEPKVDQDEKDV